MTTELRYPSLSAAMKSRWDKVIASNRKGLTPRIRALLQIGLDACDSCGPPALEAQWHGGALWICCEQEALAQLLDCSVRTIGRDFARLREFDALQAIEHPDDNNTVGYRFSLDAIETLQPSTTPRLDEIICNYAESDPGERLGVSPPCPPESHGGLTPNRSPEPPLSGPLSAGLSGPLSAGLSGPLSGGLSVPSCLVLSSPVLALAQSFQKFIPVSCHEQEQGESGLSEFDFKFAQVEIPMRSFADIDANEVRWIGGFSPDGKTPSVEFRRKMFLGYLRDAIRANFASLHDATQLAEVFSMCARRIGKKELKPLESPTHWIRGVWKNRHKRKPTTLPADRKIANELVPS